MSNIKKLQEKLFKKKQYVCGGHGARRPKHGKFKVPKGITINFYVPDGKSLSNSKGQLVDKIISGENPPKPTEVIKAGTLCHNYHLYSSKSGGYLNLGSSSEASPNYITTSDKDNGISLESIIEQVIKETPFATVHWSACRSLENDGDSFGWSKPEYSPKLLSLGKQL